ncbi:MAG: hypothetical protein ACJ74W_20965 [Pyrinomonadaceae bacterium]
MTTKNDKPSRPVNELTSTHTSTIKLQLKSSQKGTAGKKNVVEFLSNREVADDIFII